MTAEQRERARVLAALQGECPHHGDRSLVEFADGIFCTQCKGFRRISDGPPGGLKSTRLPRVVYSSGWKP